MRGNTKKSKGAVKGSSALSHPDKQLHHFFFFLGVPVLLIEVTALLCFSRDFLFPVPLLCRLLCAIRR